jgi:hypothetical protein
LGVNQHTALVLVENKSWTEDPVVAAVAVEWEVVVVPAEQWHLRALVVNPVTEDIAGRMVGRKDVESTAYIGRVEVTE